MSEAAVTFNFSMQYNKLNNLFLNEKEYQN